MRKGFGVLAAWVTISTLAPVSAFDWGEDEPVRRRSRRSKGNKNKMDLTDEEVMTLETLSGKAKKAYIKELRARRES